MFRRRKAATHRGPAGCRASTLTRRRASRLRGGPGEASDGAVAARERQAQVAERRQWPGPGSRHGASGFFGDGAATAVNVFGARGTTATFAHSSSVKGCARPQRRRGSVAPSDPGTRGRRGSDTHRLAARRPGRASLIRPTPSCVPASGGTQRTRAYRRRRVRQSPRQSRSSR